MHDGQGLGPSCVKYSARWKLGPSCVSVVSQLRMCYQQGLGPSNVSFVVKDVPPPGDWPQLLVL